MVGAVDCKPAEARWSYGTGRKRKREKGSHTRKIMIAILVLVLPGLARHVLAGSYSS